MIDHHTKICCNALDSKIYIFIKDIVIVEASGNHSYIHTINDEKIFVTNSLKDLTTRTKMHYFCRIHRQFLVNTIKVYKIYTNDGGSLEMENGQKFPLSKPGKHLLLETLKSIAI